MMLLTRVNQGDSGLSENEVKEMTEKAPDLIGPLVEILNLWRVSQHFPSNPAWPAPSFGEADRNDPCPCDPAKNTRSAIA
jgi:hypothetical protein